MVEPQAARSDSAAVAAESLSRVFISDSLGRRTPFERPARCAVPDFGPLPSWADPSHMRFPPPHVIYELSLRTF
jgi:hypothetical protein